jgi:hypothetical protein
MAAVGSPAVPPAAAAAAASATVDLTFGNIGDDNAIDRSDATTNQTLKEDDEG